MRETAAGEEEEDPKRLDDRDQDQHRPHMQIIYSMSGACPQNNVNGDSVLGVLLGGSSAGWLGPGPHIIPGRTPSSGRSSWRIGEWTGSGRGRWRWATTTNGTERIIRPFNIKTFASSMGSLATITRPTLFGPSTPPPFPSSTRQNYIRHIHWLHVWTRRPCSLCIPKLKRRPSNRPIDRPTSQHCM